MEWLNGNSGAVQAIATVVLVAVTIVYAIFTRKAANEAAKATSASSDLSETTRLAQIASLEALVLPTRVRFWRARAEDAFGSQEMKQHLEIVLTNMGPSPAFSVGVVPLLHPKTNSGAYLGEPVHPRSTGTVTVETELDPETRGLTFSIEVTYLNIFGRSHLVTAQYVMSGNPEQPVRDCLMVDQPSVKGHILATLDGARGSEEQQK